VARKIRSSLQFINTTFFTKLHGQRTKIVSTNALKTDMQIPHDFLPEHMEIVSSTNEGVLLCRAYNKSCYYVCIPSIQQWQKIPNSKTRYDTIEFGLMIERSNPLQYKIVSFSKPKFHSHKEFYMYHCIRVEFFESATWKWKLLDEVKLPHEESLHRMTKVSVNGLLHWLTWKKNVFVFEVKRESHCLFPLPSLAFEGNDNKDTRLTEYKGKFAMTWIDRESNLMEVWIMEDHDRKRWSKRHSINIEVLIMREPHVNPLAFCKVDVVLMGEYFPNMTFFNFKTEKVDMLRLGNGLLHEGFLFQLTFAIKNKSQLVHFPKE